MIWSLLTSRLVGPALAVVAALLMVSAGCQTVRLHGAQSDLTKAEKRLADVTGQLDRCQANRSALEASVKSQNAEVEAYARIQAERVSAAEKAVLAASKGRADAEARASKLLKNQPQGVDACSRVFAADRAVLESLH